MERLPHDPKNLRDIVEADLRRAARLVIKVQDEIDAQLRIATPEGDFHLAVMPDHHLDDDPLLSELLPQGAREMSAKDLATIEKWFGVRGKFPAMKIATGELGF